MRTLHSSIQCRGFSLLELLLTVGLLSLLFGALVVSFAPLTRGGNLQEGAAQLESLLHMASAKAATSGARVQIVFEQDRELNSSRPLNSIRLGWEASPLAEPGAPQGMHSLSVNLQQINELIGIETVFRQPDSLEHSGSRAVDDPDLAGDLESSLSPAVPASINFYPDGSSDSAAIVVASRNSDDERRVVIQLAGLTGTISRQFTTGAAGNGADPWEDHGQALESNTVLTE